MFKFLRMVSDPVCKMKVDKDETKHSLEYKNEKYYFCSEKCLKNFNTVPEKYASGQKNASAQNCCRQNTKSCC